MYETIKNSNKQFLYRPEIRNSERLTKKKSFLLAGMGGSALSGLLLKRWKPELDIETVRDYLLPEMPEEDSQEKLLMLSSYSGNTEETISVFEEGKKKGLEMAVIASGGRLLSLARESRLPYIELPDKNIPPRMALGYSVRALLKMTGEEEGLEETSRLAGALNPSDYEEPGRALAEKLLGSVPIIYASNKNSPLAYVWKIKLNETGKIPAFWDTLPELNHNEMEGFSAACWPAFGTDKKQCFSSKSIKLAFRFILLSDSEDHPRIQKRMRALKKLYTSCGLTAEEAPLKGEDEWKKIFSSIVLSDWTAYHLALAQGADPEHIPMVEEFKKMIVE